ncbi:protease inhibitor (Tfs1), putative [Beauveria bassiana ARSEF 2860]|uniref:Protease inhibitor (Tfs1), putative n=1 Tax=Beauveria bassiana (strain ARSEF 2860) TaxID=655819 RepID=J5JFF7_BEAB2|nr:protease inhibitor (Tfs1), putative [Beauveria bassiana ARSEF 2860]EJP64528.1 protease inhibitor (Tfs1), putative [Beauveria bassiana ARSEF 2860]
MAAIARDSSKILGRVIGDCAIEPPGLYMPPQAKPLPQIPPPRRHEPATGAVRAADLVVAPVIVFRHGSGYDARGRRRQFWGGGCIAEYLSPNPSPGSAPHRYGFYLYEQPPGFDATRWMAPAPGRQGEMGNWKRIRYGLDGWASKAGLGVIVAANYFTSN